VSLSLKDFAASAPLTVSSIKLSWDRVHNQQLSQTCFDRTFHSFGKNIELAKVTIE